MLVFVCLFVQDVSDAERWTKQLNMVQHQNRLKYLLEHPGHLVCVCACVCARVCVHV